MTSSTTSDIILFTITSAIALLLKKRGGSMEPLSEATTCASSGLKNSAFVFVKPHANTEATRSLVKEKLESAGLTILSECDISGPEIDSKKLIDQHYYAIASKATILSAKDIPVPTDKFEATFGEKWEDAVASGKACNAMEACEKFGCTADELNAAWGEAKVTKFGGGFYCGLVTYKGKSLYVFNAFFMSMRSKFVGASDSIHCYEVEWDSKTLSWSAFRNELLGPTDPADGPTGSIRKSILEQWKELGLSDVPNKGDNGVHASASPFEGLAEKNNWLERDISKDEFGAALLSRGLSLDTISKWSVDPRVELGEGEGKGSVFDALEDMDADECAAKLVVLNELNSDLL